MSLVITQDAIAEGIHFFADDGPKSIAHKALRVNLSDLAAKGATPKYISLALGLGKSLVANAGFMLGAVIGVIGLILTGLAITIEHFWYFCGALAINGIASGFVQQYRFAAADRGTKEFKPKAISMIMLGRRCRRNYRPTNSNLCQRDYLNPFPAHFTWRPFFLFLSFFALMFLNPSNLGSQQQMDNQNTGRSLTEIILQSRFLVAVFCGTSAYGPNVFRYDWRTACDGTSWAFG
ncbi:Thiamine-monophosphate kinase [Nymphon striatum]|nr:Thiamine-monophosphate kinase [Nymphon striatum]